MTDDIVTRLREQAQAPALAWLTDAADDIDRLRAEIDLKGSRLDDALDEIELLRSALALACGELSGYGPHTNSSPDHLMQELLKEARRG